MQTKSKLFALLWTVLLLMLHGFVQAQGFPAGYRNHYEALGLRFHPGKHELKPERRRNEDVIRRWNEIALNANALDHTPVAPGESRIFAEQLGPHRTARAFAIVHIAMFDAVNAIIGRYRGYGGLPAVPNDTSIDAAVAQTAHDTLAALYPSQAEIFDAELTADLDRIRDGRQKRNGVNLGQRAAEAILALRADDGAQHEEPRYGIEYVPSDEPGKWHQDPVSQIPLALGAGWPKVKPFVLNSAAQFRAPPPPALDTAEYAAAFKEVKRLGGCGDDADACEGGFPTRTDRTADQTEIGIFWGYDGTPGLGTPPRLYNQIALTTADQQRTDALELARLLALVNVAMADAGLACWETKYFYQYWRPITGIREADRDGNPATEPDASWTPLGAQASNYSPPTPDFTPPFPAYASGHATFGAAMFEILRRFYETDQIPFTFVSDELNGITRDNDGTVRPLIPRSFPSLSAAEEENGQARIYLGIHWEFDKTEGIRQGRRVADYVFENVFLPLHKSQRDR